MKEEFDLCQCIKCVFALFFELIHAGFGKSVFQKNGILLSNKLKLYIFFCRALKLA